MYNITWFDGSTTLCASLKEAQQTVKDLYGGYLVEFVDQDPKQLRCFKPHGETSLRSYIADITCI